MDIIIVIATLIVVFSCFALIMIGLDYLNNHLQKKKREEYFKNLNECIYDAINRANKG